jgi:hypothetical protein
LAQISTHWHTWCFLFACSARELERLDECASGPSTAGVDHNSSPAYLIGVRQTISRLPLLGPALRAGLEAKVLPALLVSEAAGDAFLGELDELLDREKV